MESNESEENLGIRGLVKGERGQERTTGFSQVIYLKRQKEQIVLPGRSVVLPCSGTFADLGVLLCGPHPVACSPSP